MAVPEEIKKIWQKEFGSAVFFSAQNKLWKKDWHLRAGEKLDNIKAAAGYIGRYAKRPAIAETRILCRSKLEHIVRFEHKDKITGTYRARDMTPLEFIGLPVRHIPEKHFHMISYAGTCANARKNKIFSLVCKQIISLFGLAKLLFNLPSEVKTRRQRRAELTGIDPLKCRRCRLTMALIQIGCRARDGTFKIVDLF